MNCYTLMICSDLQGWTHRANRVCWRQWTLSATEISTWMSGSSGLRSTVQYIYIPKTSSPLSVFFLYLIPRTTTSDMIKNACSLPQFIGFSRCASSKSIVMNIILHIIIFYTILYYIMFCFVLYYIILLCCIILYCIIYITHCLNYITFLSLPAWEVSLKNVSYNFFCIHHNSGHKEAS